MAAADEQHFDFKSEAEQSFVGTEQEEIHQTGAAGDCTSSALLAPEDDIFKSQLWPSMATVQQSTAAQTLDTKADPIMAYIQDMRLEMHKLRYEITAQKQKKGDATPTASDSLNTSTEHGSSGPNSSHTRVDPTTGKKLSKFEVADDKLDDLIVALNKCPVLDAAITHGIRLFMTQFHSKYGSTRHRGDVSLKAGQNFQDYLLQEAIGLSDQEQSKLRNWGFKTAETAFLDAARALRKELQNTT